MEGKKSEMKFFKAFKKGFDTAKDMGNGIKLTIGQVEYRDGNFNMLDENREILVSVSLEEINEEVKEVNYRMGIYKSYLKLLKALTESVVKDRFNGTDSDTKISLN